MPFAPPPIMQQCILANASVTYRRLSLYISVVVQIKTQHSPGVECYLRQVH